MAYNKELSIVRGGFETESDAIDSLDNVRDTYLCKDSPWEFHYSQIWHTYDNGWYYEIEFNEVL